MPSNWTDKALRKLDALCDTHVFGRTVLGWAKCYRSGDDGSLCVVIGQSEIRDDYELHPVYAHHNAVSNIDSETFEGVSVHWLEVVMGYSSRWDHAGEVFEKMRDTGRNPLLNWLPDKLMWHACMKIEGDGNWKDTGNRVAVFVEPCAHALADSPTLAITLAAVAACSGKTVEEITEECNAN